MNTSKSNFDALIKASARSLLAEDLELFHSIDTSKTRMSKKAIRRIRKKIRNYDKEPWWSGLPLVCFRAVAVLVICGISVCLCIIISFIPR